MADLRKEQRIKSSDIKNNPLKGKRRKKEVLKDSGRISHKQAVDKAYKEYEKYRVIQDKRYISSMDEMYKKYLEENNIN